MENEMRKHNESILVATFAEWVLNVGEKAEKAKEELKKMVYGLYELKQLDIHVVSWDILCSFKTTFDTNSKWVTLRTNDKDVIFNLVDRRITIISYSQLVSIKITLKNAESSDELYDFVSTLHQEEPRIDLSRIDEEYTKEKFDTIY